MSFIERLRWAIAPVERRAMALVLGSVLVLAGAGLLAIYVELPRALATLFALMMLAAWLAGVCGMIGYFRWLFNPKSHPPIELDSEPKDR